MSNYAIIDTNGNVVNVVDIEDTTQWTTPEGFTAVQSDVASIGWTYANGTFSPPVSAVPAAPTARQQIMMLEAMQTSRMVREAQTQSANVFPSGTAFAGLTSAQALASIESQIAALRATLSS